MFTISKPALNSALVAFFICLSVISILFGTVVWSSALAPTSLKAEHFKAAINKAYESVRIVKSGKNASYIPALAKTDPELFAISIVTVDGQVFEVGDFHHRFSIQSISKAFTLAKVIQLRGPEVISNQIGVNSTGK